MGLPVVQLSGQGWGGSWGAAAWMGPGSCQQARQLPGVCLPQFPPYTPRILLGSVRTGGIAVGTLWTDTMHRPF